MEICLLYLVEYFLLESNLAMEDKFHQNERKWLPYKILGKLDSHGNRKLDYLILPKYPQTFSKLRSLLGFSQTQKYLNKNI